MMSPSPSAMELAHERLRPFGSTRLSASTCVRIWRECLVVLHTTCQPQERHHLCLRFHYAMRSGHTSAVVREERVLHFASCARWWPVARNLRPPPLRTSEPNWMPFRRARPFWRSQVALTGGGESPGYQARHAPRGQAVSAAGVIVTFCLAPGTDRQHLPRG